MILVFDSRRFGVGVFDGVLGCKKNNFEKVYIPTKQLRIVF